MTRIDIDHLEIRLRNITQDRTDSIIDGLGEIILDRLHRNIDEFQDNALHREALTIDHLDVIAITAERNADSHDLQGSIAASIADSISAGIREKRSGEQTTSDSRRGGEQATSGSKRGGGQTISGSRRVREQTTSDSKRVEEQTTSDSKRVREQTRSGSKRVKEQTRSGSRRVRQQ